MKYKFVWGIRNFKFKIIQTFTLHWVQLEYGHLESLVKASRNDERDIDTAFLLSNFNFAHIMLFAMSTFLMPKNMFLGILRFSCLGYSFDWFLDLQYKKSNLLVVDLKLSNIGCSIHMLSVTEVWGVW